MNPQLYLEYETDLQVAKAEEYLGREYARTWYEQSTASVDGQGQPKTPWAGQPVAYEWIVTLGHPYYPQPPDTGPTPLQPEQLQSYYCRAKPKPGGGGVITLTDEALAWTTPQLLSDGTTYSIDFQAEQKTFEQLSAAGQVAVTPPDPWA